MSQALTPENQRTMTMTTTTMTMTTRGPPDDDDNDGNNDEVDADSDDVDEDAPPTAHLLSSDTVLARSPVRGGCWHSLDHPRPDQAAALAIAVPTTPVVRHVDARRRRGLKLSRWLGWAASTTSPSKSLQAQRVRHVVQRVVGKARKQVNDVAGHTRRRGTSGLTSGAPTSLGAPWDGSRRRSRARR